MYVCLRCQQVLCQTLNPVQFFVMLLLSASFGALHSFPIDNSVLKQFLVQSRSQLDFIRLSESLSLDARLRRSLVGVGVWRPLTLISRTRSQLAISPTGEIYASRDMADPNAELEIGSVGRHFAVIKGTQSDRYLAMTPNGRFVGSLGLTMANVFIIQHLENDYILLKSSKYRTRNWYLRINSNGAMPSYDPDTTYPHMAHSNSVPSALQFLAIYL